MRKLLTQGITLLALLGGVSTYAATPDPATELNAAQQAFINELVSEHNFDRDEVAGLLAQAELNQAVLDAIQRPWEAKPWHQYYPIFLTEKRLAAGLKFWQKHADSLGKAEQQFGVPAEVIVAIIGVETFYGGYLGNYKVLDALYTLGFHYPPRQSFFRSELKEFLLLARDEQLAATELKGSYAGAMGYGQFISSSYRHYAVDFDGDGVRDLLNNPVDAIGSVANYFVRNGWRPNAPVAIELPATPANAELASDGLKLTATVGQLTAAGLELPPEHAELAADLDAKVFRFEQPEGADYWLGLHNFYVITRYNRSPLYAMVVHQFSQQLAAARKE
ncbi:lytic murein transglycosylase B [Pseudidiomarina sp. 1APP75-32.1]|uniref:Lytic murein transglycosylase B n=1 Tax=Pseudidiomarina terrestris TaxID=2820060 RepID=A0AAW7QT57_9GAMM|nr:MULTISPECIES: lytic murein transglycosylase B [unclassified Pseudidiomarina]MDN7123337.1 lytic murein transglycosylase B [Pseudidiomarina sp. 1APP75-32.1]MDN7128938.1 lytic murein transglycosylase B [Pseudidiomarina sp. 1APR75-15]